MSVLRMPVLTVCMSHSVRSPAQAHASRSAVQLPKIPRPSCPQSHNQLIGKFWGPPKAPQTTNIFQPNIGQYRKKAVSKAVTLNSRWRVMRAPSVRMSPTLPPQTTTRTSMNMVADTHTEHSRLLSTSTASCIAPSTCMPAGSPRSQSTMQHEDHTFRAFGTLQRRC